VNEMNHLVLNWEPAAVQVHHLVFVGFDCERIVVVVIQSVVEVEVKVAYSFGCAY
jgi:hypothetical protein